MRLPSLRAVALVVQRAAVAIGLDVATFAGRSLRAGFATSTKRIGPGEWRLDDERHLDACAKQRDRAEVAPPGAAVARGLRI